MEFYVKPCTAESSLFAIYGTAGELLYQVAGENSALSGKLYLVDGSGKEAAKIRRLGTPEISRYSISVQGKEHAGVLQNFIGTKPAYRLYGVPWSFRGDVLSRSFDVIDVDGGVLMTHGYCWKGRGDCFAVTVTREADVPVCLSIAVVIDSLALNGGTVVLPVSN